MSNNTFIRVLVMIITGLLTPMTWAEDELLLYVFQSGQPQRSATITIDGEVAGSTRLDGSLTADLNAGGHVVAVDAGGEQRVVRFSLESGQLADVVIELAAGASPLVDVYGSRESAAERRDQPKGSLEVAVTRDGAPVTGTVVNLSNGGGRAASDEEGVATIEAPRGRYSVTVDGKRYTARIFAGVTRGLSVRLASEAIAFELERPQLEEVVVLGSFDPGAFELSERDTGNIVDTLGVEQLARYGDSDVAASIVRVPGVSVQNDKYVVIRGLVIVMSRLTSTGLRCHQLTRHDERCHWIFFLRVLSTSWMLKRLTWRRCLVSPLAVIWL